MLLLNGTQLVKATRKMFKLSPDDRVTMDQLNYVLMMSKPSNYIVANHTIRGKPITFNIPDHNINRALAHRPFQVGILNDTYQDVIIIKSRQLGLSELGIEQLIWWLDTHSFDRVNALYTFPTNRQLEDFVAQRLQPEFNHGYYRSLIYDPKSMTLKKMKIRDSNLVFRSSSSGATMEGMDLDFVSLDEYDRLNPLAEQSALQGMTSSKYKMLRRWSTPTVPSYGIHKLFEQSDQRRWYHKCSHCGYEQVLDYEKNIQQINPDGVDDIGLTVQPGTFQFVCAKCGRPLDRWYSGHWVTERPLAGRTHGYSISQMDAVWVSADQLKQDELRAPSKQFFYNYSLGMPYEDKSVAFHDYDVYSNEVDYEKPEQRTDEYRFVATGIDWGEHNHTVVTIGMTTTGQIRVMDITFIPRSTGTEHIEQDLNQVVRKINQYNPDIICPDLGFSGSYDQKLLAYYGPEKVYSVKVRSAKTNGDYNSHFSDVDNTVIIDKYTQNMMMIANIKRGDIKFWRGSRLDPIIQTFIKHAQNVVFRTDEKEDPATHTIVYDKVILRKGPDHSMQTLVYSFVGLDKLMKEYALAHRNAIEMQFLSPELFNGEQTDLQREYGVTDVKEFGE